jgi:hypothetical protein
MHTNQQGTYSYISRLTGNEDTNDNTMVLRIAVHLKITMQIITQITLILNC